MALRACERTECKPKAVGWRPLGVYGLRLGPRICGRCHAMRYVAVRVAERCWLGHPGAQSALQGLFGSEAPPVSYTHLRAHETDSYLVCRLLLEKKKKK